MIVLKEGKCCGRQFRATFEEHLDFYDGEGKVTYITKVQIQRKFLCFKWFSTIKKWCSLLWDDDTMYDDCREKLFVQNEAIELFDKIVDPYGV